MSTITFDAHKFIRKLRSAGFEEKQAEAVAEAFQEDYSHEQVFGDLADDEFTASEVAEYLKVSLATFRRYVQRGKITSSHVVGRNQFFATKNLKSFKRSLLDVKGKAN